MNSKFSLLLDRTLKIEKRNPPKPKNEKIINLIYYL